VLGRVTQNGPMDNSDLTQIVQTQSPRRGIGLDDGSLVYKQTG